MMSDDSSRLPGPFSGPAAWYGRDLGPDDWAYRLSDPEVAEIDRMVERVAATGVDLAAVDRAAFDLPALRLRLAELYDTVVRGRGFVVVRGLPVDRYGPEAAAIAFWGLGMYFGVPVSQNAQGHLLGHVCDLGLDPANPEHRVYATSARHRFHTDSCVIVGLCCVRPARRGGESSIVSSVTIYNELLARRPDLVRVLMEPFWIDRKGEIPSGKAPYYAMPVFHWHEGLLTTIYARDFIEGAQRFEEVPRLTAEQVEAMDAFDGVAARPDVRLDFMAEPGDVQFLHNHQTLHARTAFEDHPDPARRRHLLRLWLAPPDGRPLPAVFAERYGSVEPGARGGIRVPGAEACVPLRPGEERGK